MRVVDGFLLPKEFPEKFSDYSAISSLSKEDYRRGIALDSIDQVAEAILTYDKEEIGKGMILSFLTENNYEFDSKRSRMYANTLADAITNSLREEGSFNGSQDESTEIQGTNFLGTSFFCDKEQSKYVLKMFSFFDGRLQERTLAEILGKKRPLREARVICNLDIVDDYWFNVDLSNELSGLNSLGNLKKTVKGQWNEVAENIVLDNFLGKKEFFFWHEFQKFKLEFDMDYLTRKKKGEEGINGLQSIGSTVRGNAWNEFEDGFYAIDEPSLIISTRMTNNGLFFPFGRDAIYQPQVNKVQSARDYIFNLLDDSA